MFNVEVNWLAIGVSGIAYMVLGFLWYGPLFGAPWMKLLGKTKKDIENEMKEGGMGKTYGASFLTALVMAYVTNVLVVLLNVTDVASAVGLGVMLWLGYVATSYASQVLYENKKFKLYLINVGYYLVTIVVAAVILTLWA
jgi:hypothetical protein